MPGKQIAITAVVPLERIERSILLIRDHKVMLDSDLADLYAAPTKQLVRAVKRNLQRFPADFMFQLSLQETANLRRQFGTSSWGGRRYRPYAFTEQGVAMLSSVLRSPRAIAVNILIMRAFVRLRQYLASHEDLRLKLEEFERRLGQHDEQIAAVFEAIRQLMDDEAESPRKPPIGFHTEEHP
jgi:hypothetical protein